MDRLTGAQQYQLSLQKQRDVEQVLEFVCDPFSPAFVTISKVLQGPEEGTQVVNLWDPSVANRRNHGSARVPTSRELQLQMISLVSLSNASLLVLADRKSVV